MSHLDQALTQHGFALVRTRKHQVYKRADGTTFVTPSTPSDVRWERPALADFARIVGKTKRELTSHALPKRARRKHSRLEPLPQPAILAPVAVADFPNPVPELSAQDRKLLKRLERYQANREKKRIAREKKLMPYITKAHQMYLAEYETVPHVQFKIAQALAESLRRLSYDAEPVICGVVGESSVTDTAVTGFAAVRCSTYYLDFLAVKIHPAATWEVETDDGVIKAEAIISMQDLSKERKL
jgi:hypothetical protein